MAQVRFMGRPGALSRLIEAWAFALAFRMRSVLARGSVGHAGSTFDYCFERRVAQQGFSRTNGEFGRAQAVAEWPVPQYSLIYSALRVDHVAGGVGVARAPDRPAWSFRRNRAFPGFPPGTTLRMVPDRHTTTGFGLHVGSAWRTGYPPSPPPTNHQPVTPSQPSRRSQRTLHQSFLRHRALRPLLAPRPERTPSPSAAPAGPDTGRRPSSRPPPCDIAVTAADRKRGDAARPRSRLAGGLHRRRPPTPGRRQGRSGPRHRPTARLGPRWQAGAAG